MGKAVKILSAKGQVLNHRVCAIETKSIICVSAAGLLQIERFSHPVSERYILVTGNSADKGILPYLSIKAQFEQGQRHIRIFRFYGKNHLRCGYFCTFCPIKLPV